MLSHHSCAAALSTGKLWVLLLHRCHHYQLKQLPP
jgi:hypothetical protein